MLKKYARFKLKTMFKNKNYVNFTLSRRIFFEYMLEQKFQSSIIFEHHHEDDDDDDNDDFNDVDGGDVGIGVVGFKQHMHVEYAEVAYKKTAKYIQHIHI